MPQVQRQTAQAKPKNKETGSILSEAISVSELENDFVKMVLYGQNRTGKTTLACQFPKPLLLISFEPADKSGGAISVKKIPGVEFLQVGTVDRAIRLAKELQGNTDFKTHVIDSVTSCQDIVLKDILGLDDAPVQQNWGEVSRDDYRRRSEQTKEVLRLYSNLQAHTIFLAKERDHNPQEKDKPTMLRGSGFESFFAADLGGQTVGWLQDACDYICRLYLEKETIVEVKKKDVIVKGKDGKKRTEQREVTVEKETGKVVRRLRTLYHPNFSAGFRSPDPDRVPEFLQAVTPKAMYEAVWKLIKGE